MNQPDGESDQQKSDKNHLHADAPTNGGAEVGPELNAETADEATSKPGPKEEPSLSNDWHKPLGIPITEWLVAVFTLVIMASSIVYTVYAKKQWKVMRESNEINRESLESVQRAFVNYLRSDMSTGRANLPKGKHVDFIDMAPVWQNSGNTPAIGITTLVGAAEREEEPTEDEFLSATQIPKIKGVIAAKAEQPTSDIRVAKSFADDTVSTPRFLWGWIVYRDIFQKKAHVTEFCIKAVEIRHFQDGHLHFSGGVCDRHNCVDEFCDDYSTIAAKTESP
jgi:hypothetical protein